MVIESLQLHFHLACFRCCVCRQRLGNGTCGTDVRVRNSKLHCHNCNSYDEGTVIKCKLDQSVHRTIYNTLRIIIPGKLEMSLTRLSP